MKAWTKESVRLVDGQSASEGRVEVYYSGTWGVVCGAGWDMLDAAVVCRSLGYGGVSSYLVNITFKPENGTIWMSDVQCIGNETSLSQCAHSGWGRNSCRESQAAGVMCFEKARPQFISSTFDTITLEYRAPIMTDVTYTVQMWSNTTKKWRDARCRQSTVSNSCVVKNLNTRTTLTDLIPGHAYYVRVTSSPFQVFSQVSLGMETKKLGIPVEPQLVSRSTSFVALRWTSNNSVTTNYTVEVKCCDEATWVEAQCPESLIGLGCTVADTMATVIGLRADTKYYFRVYAVYKNWKSAASTSSVEVKTKSRKTDILPYGIWISPVTPTCVTSDIGHVLTLFCNMPGSNRTTYEWTKEGRVLSNNSLDGAVNVSISTSEDFGVYTCHAITSDGVTSYNISVCRSTGDVKATSKDPFNRTAIAVITACFICFAVFIVVLILLKMARIHRRKKRQSLDINSGREEMAMLHYRQKSIRSGNNNEEDLD